jgi:hypothetical protein
LRRALKLEGLAIARLQIQKLQPANHAFTLERMERTLVRADRAALLAAVKPAMVPVMRRLAIPRDRLQRPRTYDTRSPWIVVDGRLEEPLSIEAFACGAGTGSSRRSRMHSNPTARGVSRR